MKRTKLGKEDKTGRLVWVLLIPGDSHVQVYIEASLCQGNMTPARCYLFLTLVSCILAIWGKWKGSWQVGMFCNAASILPARTDDCSRAERRFKSGAEIFIASNHWSSIICQAFFMHFLMKACKVDIHCTIFQLKTTATTTNKQNSQNKLLKVTEPIIFKPWSVYWPSLYHLQQCQAAS